MTCAICFSRNCFLAPLFCRLITSQANSHSPPRTSSSSCHLSLSLTWCLMGSGIRALQKHLEGDNRLWAGVMEPFGGTSSCLAYVLIFSGLGGVGCMHNIEDKRDPSCVEEVSEVHGDGKERWRWWEQVSFDFLDRHL